MRVLLIEDEMILRRVAGAMLQKLGCDVTTATNGEEALSHAQSAWDLVLMDCQMPVLDGLAATLEWRVREPGHALIIALTGATSDEERARCLGAGMDDFVSKPLTPDKIKHLLERVAPKHEPESGDADAILSPPMRELCDEYQGFESLLLELARAFDAQLPQLLAQLLAILSQTNADSVAQAAHAFKGKALSLHAHALSAPLDAIEHAAQQGDLNACRAQIPALDAGAVKARSQLRALIKSLS